MLNFNSKYFYLTIFLLITEIIIAIWVHDAFIRPFGGDFLVVILIYCLVKSFMDSPVSPTILSVLLFAYAVFPPCKSPRIKKFKNCPHYNGDILFVDGYADVFAWYAFGFNN